MRDVTVARPSLTGSYGCNLSEPDAHERRNARGGGWRSSAAPGASSAGAEIRSGRLDWLAVYTLLAFLQVIIAVVLIFLILLHSGKDAGLSGAFGIGGGGSSFGGGSMVERNLDRATVFFAVLFVVNTLVLLKI
jgi:preprotein translocase subunit SecG